MADCCWRQWGKPAAGAVRSVLCLYSGLGVRHFKRVENRACNIIATVFVGYHPRCANDRVGVFYVYFAVPMLLNNILHLEYDAGMKGQITFSALQAGTICLALNCGAYMAEIIRAGIESRGQRPDGGSPQPGPGSYWRAMYRVSCCRQSGYDDPLDHQPVYHYPEKDTDPRRSSVSLSWSTPPKTWLRTR